MSVYLAIDLKSFYASVECVERGLDPLDTHLVVADEKRTEKTICLAVTPALKAYGIPGRVRLFEVMQKAEMINRERLRKNGYHAFSGASASAKALETDASLQLQYLVAPPQMAHYIQISTQIYQIYLRYVAPEDIHVYSIDEVFIDISSYLKMYHCTPRALAERMIKAVLRETGITATVGIGSNLYLAKVAMDIVAKHMPADQDGVRIAQLDEISYRKQLWDHQPLTDFWRIGNGYQKKLSDSYLYTMGDIARCSLQNEDKLYRLFGVNAELLIDHAWGWEPCTIADIKAYRPENHSISQGQVLSCPYSRSKARLIVKEMTDQLVLDLVGKGLAADQVTLTVGYDGASVPDDYHGILQKDRYGKKIPKQAHGSRKLEYTTDSFQEILKAVLELFDQITDEKLMVRRMYVVANHVIPAAEVPEERPVQLNLFEDAAAIQQAQEHRKMALEREHRLQKTLLAIKGRYGKNAILKGMNFQEGATARERNGQVGGHRA
ncbi:DNA methylase [uncultured Ruminococcus sp.]|uniref:Y-family DNA polymerase n=1 Tax=uncultured Ruminococcus sp. TaxID=165186 RepID=UPI0025D176C5|nr:DNA methylase [uncultured Ruminococcus sp.]